MSITACSFVEIDGLVNFKKRGLITFNFPMNRRLLKKEHLYPIFSFLKASNNKIFSLFKKLFFGTL